MKRSPQSVVPDDERRAQVRDRYATIATRGQLSMLPQASSCCGSGSASSCCGDSGASLELGYTAEQLAALPDGANLGLGCGNPTAIAGLTAGQAVLDLGSGAGIDCFLAAKNVGEHGSVVGVDMTPEMISKARANARKGGYKNVEFRLGEIEHLPAADGSFDVVISNCVINLAPEKGKVYGEAFRVLRPGGRLAVSDVVATRPITAKERADPSLWSSCSSGALEVKQIKALLRRAGFVDVRVALKDAATTPSSLEAQASLGVASADIRATRPLARER
jgi:arsenite methyltransferase